MSIWTRTVAKYVYISKVYFRGCNDWPWWWTEYGQMGEWRRKKTCDFPLEQVGGQCYDLRWGREPQPHLWQTYHSERYPFFASLCQKQTGEINLTCVRGRGSHLGDQRALYQGLYWLNSMRLIPQRLDQSFCRGLRESISGITSPIIKTTNEMLPTLCILEKQRSFHWGTSLSCPWMFSSKLSLKQWIK